MYEFAFFLLPSGQETSRTVQQTLTKVFVVQLKLFQSSEQFDFRGHTGIPLTPGRTQSHQLIRLRSAVAA